MVQAMQYFPSEADAIAYTNLITANSSYTVGSYGGYTYWRIAARSTGSSPQNAVYAAGSD